MASAKREGERKDRRPVFPWSFRPSNSLPTAGGTWQIDAISNHASVSRHGSRSVELILGLLLGVARATLAQSPVLPAEVEARIQSRITNQYCPGFVVGMINSNAVQFYSFGHAAWDSPELVNEDSLFEIGSITKTFTATLLSDMVLHDGLALTDPVQQYLPDSVSMPTREGKVITLQHLATHTSALPFMPTNMEVGNAVSDWADYGVQDLYEFLSSYRLPHDPGTVWEYSNLGGGLLGHALALHEGTSFENLMVERMANALGMPDTRITLTPDQQRRLVRGYSGVAPRPYFVCPTLAGGGSLRSTARDLATLLAANLGLRPSPLYPAMTNAQQLRFSGTMQMGLGWIMSPTISDPIIWHDGSTWGFYTFLGFRPDKKLGVVVLANSHLDISSTIGFHLLDPSSPLDADEIPVAVPLENLRSCVGRYSLGDNEFFEITLQNGHLTFIHSSDPSLTFTLYPSSPWTFFLRSPILSATAAFQANAQGLVTSMLWTQSSQSLRYPKVPMPVQLSLQRLGGQTRLSFTGDPGLDYVVEACDNLAAWTPISTNTIWDLPWVDPASDQWSHRFYRVRRN
jgi:serine-type D-Ala-D-Ala carboxypeptidase/endopeptidase